METPLLSLLSTKKVPNEFPSASVTYKLAIIGEAPGAEEEAYGRPFVGASGRLLDSILASAGILRSGCFVGNVCQHRPPDNKIENFGYTHPRVLEGMETLKNDLSTYSPNCTLALGNTPLHFLCSKKGITSWRGSILDSPFGKVVPSIHPAALLREYKSWPLLRFDSVRARKEAEFPETHLPQRTLELDLTADEMCFRLDTWPTGQLLSFDIEGGLEAFPCCSCADAPNRAFVIAWSKFSESDQARLYKSLSQILYRIDVPKVLQNSLYDRFVLAYGFRMLIRSVVEDTMLKTWEIYPELPKGLGTQASIWTREPYYKHDRKTDDANVLYRYCAKDAAVTLEACRAQDGAISPNALRHYKFNMDLLSPLLYMELRGIRYDKTAASAELATVKAALSEAATRLEVRAGYSLTGAKGGLSATKLKRCLYSEKGYPEQKTGRGPAARVTTDVEALLKLAKKFPHDPFISDILLHRKLESIVETLEIETDPDGRVRCGYNLVGTETGRLTCYTSPTGSGANLQTITKKLRRLYLADDDHWMFQCDLSGADGWTVAAHCVRHGDGTMWDDYMAGLKPARIVALMYSEKGKDVAACSRDELKSRCASVDDDGWLYFTCKRIQHASNYGVRELTISKQIMVDSYKVSGTPVYIEPAVCAAIQRLYFARYSGVYHWHEWARRQVEEGRPLTSASGHTRTFFGRRKSYDNRLRSFAADHETFKEFLADEPQENTTYATNCALSKMWNDESNRDENGNRLYIEPLHQVHDAIIGQFPKARTDWAKQKIKEWFQSTLQIANSEVIIPYEGKYGRSWGELTEGTL